MIPSEINRQLAEGLNLRGNKAARPALRVLAGASGRSFAGSSMSKQRLV